MPDLEIIGIFLLIAGIILGIPTLLQKIVTHHYRQLAQDLKLKYVNSPDNSSNKISGLIKKGDYNAEVKIILGTDGHYLEVTLNHLLKLHSSLQIAKTKSFQYKLGQNIFRTGHEYFDDSIFITSVDPDDTRAILNAQIRQALLDMASKYDDLSITPFKLYVKRQNNGFVSAKEIHASIEELIQISRMLQPQKTLLESMADMAYHDPHIGVRKQNIAALYRSYPEEALTRTIINNSLKDKDRSIRVFTALLLKEKGRDILFNEILTPGINNEDLQSILDEIRLMKYPDSSEFLIKSYKLQNDIQIQVQLLETLTDLEESSNETFFLSELQEHPRDWLSEYLIHALGQCATLEAVEPLYKLEKAANSLSLQKNSLHSAIATIQNRYSSSAQRGSLSISESAEQEGGLSIHGEGAGGLSLED